MRTTLTWSSAEQANFAEIIAARQIGQHQFAAGVSLRNFHEAEPHEIKTVGGISLFADHLAGREAQQLDAIAQMVDEILFQAAEDGDIS